jgi:ectoine hydroxylase-related dioxygenase (phytanoyl-CoA dioxygenase family)
MVQLLSDAERERYRRDGFFHPVTVMEAAEAASFRARVEAAESRFGALHYVVKPHLVLQVADELAHRAAMLDAVADILGPDLLLWDATFIIKEPAAKAFVSWHQDLTYWGLESDDPDDVASVWLALSPATVATGCMRMVPGSHRRGRLDHRETRDSANVLSRGQTVEVDEACEGYVYTELQPGQMSIHHGWTLHASGPNHSTDRRIGFNLNFARPRVRQVKHAGDWAMLMRGQDRYGHFRLEPRPTGDFAGDAGALQAAIAQLRGEEMSPEMANRLINPLARGPAPAS